GPRVICAGGGARRECSAHSLAALTDPRFRQCLAGVWRMDDMSDWLWSRIVRPETGDAMDAVNAAVIALLVTITLYAGLRRLPEDPDAPAAVSVYPVGQTAVVVHIDEQSSGPPYQALVRVAGETWAARLDAATRVGEAVCVDGGDGLTLICTKDLGTPEITAPTDGRAARLVNALHSELLLTIRSVQRGPVTRRRLIMAIMCGLAVFTAMTCGLAVA